MSNVTRTLCTVDYATTIFIGTDNDGYTLSNSFPAVSLVVDGIVASIGDIILVKNQTLNADNGIYEVIRLNSVINSLGYQLNRVCMELEQIYIVFVKRGNTQSVSLWCTDLDFPPYTPGVTDQIFIEIPLGGDGNLQQAYNNSTPGIPEIVLDAIRGALTLRDNPAPIGGNIFEVQTSIGTNIFNVDATGATVTGKLTVTGLIDPPGLTCSESAANPGVVAAGDGTYWVKDDIPNVPIFTDDLGVDHNLLTSGNLQDVYNNSTDPELVLTAVPGGISILDNVIPLGTNLLEIQNNARTTTFLSVDSTGVIVDGKLTVTGMIDPPGLTCSESTINPGIVVAGDGTYWVKDNIPNIPIFTDDTGIDHNLLTSGTLQDAYNNSIDPELVLTVAPGGISILDNAIPLGTNLFEIQNNTRTTDLFSVNASTGIQVTGQTILNGNLTVNGTTTSINTQNLLVTDRFIFANSVYNLDPAVTAGFVMNCDPDPTAQVSVGGTGFTAGIVATSNPTVLTTGGPSVFVVGDIILITGANNASNNGLYEVLSHTGGGDPETLTIKGIGLVSTTIDFVQDQFVTDTIIAGLITKTNVSVLRSKTNCDLEVTRGADTTSITTNAATIIKSIASAGGTETLVVTGTGPNITTKGLTAGTGISLLGGASDVTITNTDGGSSVTLSSAGGIETLVVDGTGPTLSNKGLTAGTGISLLGGASDVTITNTLDTFLELTDTPSIYTGAANRILGVNTGETAVLFSNNEVGINSDTTGTSISLGTGSSVAANTGSIAIGDTSVVTAGAAIAMGVASSNDISETMTVNSIPMIHNTTSTGILGGAAWAGNMVAITSGIVDLKTIATGTITLPAGLLMFVNQIDIIKLEVSTAPTDATLDFGFTGTPAGFVTGLLFGSGTDNAVGARTINTGLLTTVGKGSLVIDVTTASVAVDPVTARVVFIGYVIHNE